ncbi:MAG: HAD-IC family P-type ATPase, partial [Planctomycetaceae bacterium]|nr:HAD-IC family P-type ATPase [Planctomycetaceae bacterium]
AIEDPIRDDAAATLGLLRQCGISDITMLTGDGQRTAAAVAAVLDIRDFHSGLLPVDKANLIKEMQRNGRTVVFVGDGVNDSPALSAAAVGVSLKDGSDIAREVAGVVLADGRLASLMTARMLSELAIRRVTRQFGFIMGVNSLLIFLGLFGAITPRVAALLHNLATVLVTANSVKGVLPNWLRGKVIEMPEDAAEAEQEDTGELGGEASSRPVTA